MDCWKKIGIKKNVLYHLQTAVVKAVYRFYLVHSIEIVYIMYKPK